MTGETVQADDRGVTQYPVEGYEWEQTGGHEIEEGTLLPGHGSDIWEVREKAGYSLDLEKTYYVTMMVDDGDYDFLPDFTTHRPDNNDAMRERTSAESIDTDGWYWTLTEVEA